MERRSTADLADLCTRTQAALAAEQEALAQERATLEAEKAALGQLGGTEEVLELNVGGRLLTTKRGTLAQGEGLLGGMFSGRWEDSFTKDAQGRIFLDFDPDCFEVVLHELRTQSLTSEPIKWASVKAPPGKQRYFFALRKFLAMRKQTGFVPTFGPKSMKVRLDDNNTTAKSEDQGGSSWALGDTVMQGGLYSWGFQIRNVAHWIGLGVIANANPPDSSYNAPGSYMWACSGQVFCNGQDQRGHQVFYNGQDQRGHGGWSNFQTGDHVTMQLDADNGVLRMKVARLAGQTFELVNIGSGNRDWRINVNFRHTNDKVELLPCDDF